MNEREARDAYLAALAEVAPEADPSGLDPGIDLGEQLELDSIDFLNLVVAVAQRTGVEVPEADYPQLRTVDGAVSYLAGAQEKRGLL